jgi:hypothetical protein
MLSGNLSFSCHLDQLFSETNGTRDELGSVQLLQYVQIKPRPQSANHGDRRTLSEHAESGKSATLGVQLTTGSDG